MTPEKQKVLMAIRASFNTLKFSFGVRRPEEVVDFEFISNHEMNIESQQGSCGCQNVKADDHRVWGTLTLGSESKYHAAGDLFERNGEYYTKQKLSGGEYFNPINPADMILVTEESEKEFKAVKAAKESKSITVLFDDGEPEFYIDEHKAKKVNTEKIQIPLIIDGWVLLD